MIRVVDTSVVLKWVVPEHDSDEALAWVGLPLIAPDLVRAELANALWKKVRRGEIGPGQAAQALEEMPAALALAPTPPLIAQALLIALELSHPVYDCVFLALAQKLEVPLLTADGRFIQACADTVFAESLQLLNG